MKFEKGQKAVVLRMNAGRNADPVMREVTVEKVGRKYITVDGWYYDTKFLIEEPHYCDSDRDVRLCVSREEAEHIIAARENAIKLSHYNFHQLPLEMLQVMAGLVEAYEMDAEFGADISGLLLEAMEPAYKPDRKPVEKKEANGVVHKIFKVGDIVYVSNPDLAYEKEMFPRKHRNFFGRVVEVDNFGDENTYDVRFEDDVEFCYMDYELSLAKDLKDMTLEDFSDQFGVEVNAKFLR